MARGTLFAALVLSLLLPGMTLAATFSAARHTVTVSNSPSDNAYFAGAQVTVTAPLPADISATAATIDVYAPVAGDALLAGGTIDLQQPIGGDIRAVGGRITVENDAGGDLVAAGGSVTMLGKAKDTRIAAGTIRLANGSNGPVKLYGADISLSGEFNGDVYVVASDKLVVADGTIIHGSLKYNAPQQVVVPASAKIDGGVTYTGASSYLPTPQEARTFAIAGAGVFFVVRIIAVLIVAGLFAGLFPLFTQRIVEHTLNRSPRRFVLMTLLGFAMVVATPVLLILLAISFVGLGLTIFGTLLYLLLLLLSYISAGVIAGAALMRGLFKRQGLSWQSAVLGMLVLYLVGIIPVLGGLVMSILCATAAGTIVSLTYHFAFRREEIETSL